jgi:gliding motility-associatede transport system auxiliary component
MKLLSYRPLLSNLANLVFAATLLAAAVALYQLAANHPLQTDITWNASNSLEPGSIQVLQQLHGPVQLTVFSAEQDVRRGDMRKLIRRFVALYQRYKPDISLSFVDPAQQPDEARRADIQNNGEMVVEYDGRREHLTRLNEQSLTGALLSLAHRQEQLVMYVTDHGERKLGGRANYDLGEFGERLGHLGFRISSINLALVQDVPENVSLLVVTQPQTDWLPGELDKLLRYLDNGGNLLWLMDAGPLHGLERLSAKLGLKLTPGIVIDPDAGQMRAPATWALGTSYPAHAITRNFNLVTAFPFARALGWKKTGSWRYDAIVEAAPRGWVSTSLPNGGQSRPSFHKGRDVPGPATIALAMQRNIHDRQQRIVVVGSGAFLANTYAGNGGNLDLGINMVNWLSQQDNLITIAPRAARDNTVTLSKRQLAFISIGMVIVLPLLLILVGGMVWWRRR